MKSTRKPSLLFHSSRAKKTKHAAKCTESCYNLCGALTCQSDAKTEKSGEATRRSRAVAALWHTQKRRRYSGHARRTAEALLTGHSPSSPAAKRVLLAAVPGVVAAVACTSPPHSRRCGSGCMCSATCSCSCCTDSNTNRRSAARGCALSACAAPTVWPATAGARTRGN